MSLKDVSLHRFFLGNNYYGIKGLKLKDSSFSLKLTKINSSLRLKMKNRFISEFNEGLLFENPLTFYLHDLMEIKSKKIQINFNKYKTKSFYFIPTFNKENLELLRNRSSKIFTLNENLKLVKLYSSDEYKSLRIPDLNQIKFHISTKVNFEALRKIKIYPKSFDSFIFIHNPLTGYYTCLPLLERFQNIETDILGKLEKKINYEIERDTIILDTIFIKKNLTVDNTIKFDNKVVLIEDGVKIIFKNKSKFIFNSSKIEFNGFKRNNIILIGGENNSMLFNKCDVKFKNVSVVGFGNFTDDMISLPSAITFYNSNVEIQNSLFENNLSGDDFINLYNSTFRIENSNFNYSLSDAVDSDFSKGDIINSSFTEIGNDALDFSGSSVVVKNCNFKYVQDKALSAGENSKIDFSENLIETSELGLVVKDGSYIEAQNNIFRENKVDLAVFFKKDFYSSPILKIDSISNDFSYLFQRGVNIICSNKIRLNYTNNVESLLYGNYYGKSSR